MMAIIIIACKKKEPTPEPVHVPTCDEKQTKKFEGRYTRSGAPNDTLTIAFVKNNCPKENSDQYLVKNLYKATITATASAGGIENRDYTTNSDEKTGPYLWMVATGLGYADPNNVFKFAISSGGQVYMTCYYLEPTIIYWTKL